MIPEKSVPIKCYNKSQLRLMYGVGRNTFQRWIIRLESRLIPAGYVRTQSIFTAKQVEIVFSELCPPDYETYAKIMGIKE